jgi:hypothetical protein
MVVFWLVWLLVWWLVILHWIVRLFVCEDEFEERSNKRGETSQFILHLNTLSRNCFSRASYTPSSNNAIVIRTT